MPIATAKRPRDQIQKQEIEEILFQPKVICPQAEIENAYQSNSGTNSNEKNSRLNLMPKYDKRKWSKEEAQICFVVLVLKMNKIFRSGSDISFSVEMAESI